MENKRLFTFKGILWFFTGLAAAVTVVRFALGLGVSTVLGDSTPWGLWIGFGDYSLLAMSAGGFVTAAVVHVFHRKKYEPAARPAILTALLGYGGVTAAVIFDLGLPWNVWHPVVFWNIHSPLFEVSWCIMLYLMVLVLELAPVILERTPLQRVYRLLKKTALPVMILGIMLSTLHQSSVGSMLLIMPFRVHPLWYTHLLPELFFVSAICFGIMTVMFVCFATPWLYRREPKMEMLSGFARIMIWCLSFYFVFKMADLAIHHKLALIFAGTWESNLFVLEMLLSVIFPVILFSIPAVRRSPRVLWLAVTLGVSGFALDRINVSGLVQVWATRSFYFPSWMEIVVNVGIVSALALIFLFIEEHFPVEPSGLKEIEEQRRREEEGLPNFAPFTEVWLGEGWRKSLKVYSLLFVAAMALGFTMVPKKLRLIIVPVPRARGEENLRVGASPHFVYFDHKTHQDNYGGKKSCELCHHLHKPGDVGTPCNECHRGLYTTTKIFDHPAHVKALKGELSCAKCHGEAKPVVLGKVKACEECHKKDMMAKNPVVKIFKKESAPSYKNAMHKMCIPCHVKEASNPKYNRPNLGRCGACHNTGTKTEEAWKKAFPLQEGNGGT